MSEESESFDAYYYLAWRLRFSIDLLIAVALRLGDGNLANMWLYNVEQSC